MRNIFIALAMLVALTGVAMAQNNYSTANGTIAPVAVHGCLNGSLVAIPIGPACQSDGSFKTNASGVNIRPLAGTKPYCVTASAAGSTTLIPASAGQRWFLTGATVEIDGSASTTGAAELTTSIEDGSTIILTGGFYAPGNPTAAVVFEPINIASLSLISSTVNQALNLNLSAAITGGLVRACVQGGYTTQTP